MAVVLGECSAGARCGVLCLWVGVGGNDLMVSNQCRVEWWGVAPAGGSSVVQPGGCLGSIPWIFQLWLCFQLPQYWWVQSTKWG